MNRFVSGAARITLLALAWVCTEAALSVRVARAQIIELPVFLKGEITSTRQALIAEVQQVRVSSFDQIAIAQDRLLREVTAVRQDSLSLIDTHAWRIEDKAVGEIQGLRADLRSTAKPLVESSVALMGEYQSIPGEIRQDLRPWLDCRGNGACWPAQITATLGATRATLGQVARSAPRVAISIERSALASEHATQATAQAMSNVAALTKPLPRWARVPLQILGPTAPLWSPFLLR